MSNAIKHVACSDPQLVANHYSNHSIMSDTEMEVARLLEERELLLQHEGGILPEIEDLSGITTILNIASGPGTWAAEAASLFTDMKIIGIDPNQRLVNFARSRTRRLDNTRFLVMDVTQPFDFPDGAFDLVNAQYLQGILTTPLWPSFVHECVRVVRSGGIVRFTEAVCTESNSHDFNRLTALLPLALYRARRSFSPDTDSMGIAFMLAPFLREANCQHIRHRSFVVDYSSGTETYNQAIHHVRVTYSYDLLGSFFIKTGVVEAEEYQMIYNKAMRAMASPGFCALWHFLTVSGKKAQASIGNAAPLS